MSVFNLNESPQDSNRTSKAAKHLDYPRVQELLDKAQERISKGEKAIFHCIDAHLHHLAVPDNFKFPKDNKEELAANWELRAKPFFESPVLAKVASVSCSGSFAYELNKIQKLQEMQESFEQSNFSALATLSHSLLSKQLASTKVLGDFNFAYIEARAAYYFKQRFLPNKSIDSFWCAEGLSNIDLFADVLKANEIPKDELVVLSVPVNAIKAFREEKFGDWQELEFEQSKASFAGGLLHQYDKYGNAQAEVKLVESHAKNLKSPVYKIRAGEYWVLVVPVNESAAGLFSLSPERGGFTKAVEDRLAQSSNQGNITLQVDHHDLNIIADNKERLESIEKTVNYDLPTEGIISCSIGQAARVIYELLGGFDNIPEALFYVDGGSWSSVVTEKNSDGRHLGIHDMYKIIKNKWHEREDVQIPWNLLGHDVLDKSTEHLLDDEEIFILSPDGDKTKALKEKLVYLEAPQSWKQVLSEFLRYFTKAVYGEFTIFATRKYHINIRDCSELLSKYMAVAALYSFDEESQDYKEELAKLELPDELLRFVKIISYVHFASSSTADFYSAKTHPCSIIRLQWLAKAHLEFKKLCPDFAPKFEAQIKTILKEDQKSEFTTLENLYFSELNKIT